jgi:hypothetical protein
VSNGTEQLGVSNIEWMNTSELIASIYIGGWEFSVCVNYPYCLLSKSI